MNRYGSVAERHWKTYLPNRYATIADPATFFTQLGEQISDEIAELADTIAGSDPPGESYLEKVGRLNAAQQMARERVLAEMLPTIDTEKRTTPASRR